MDTNEVLDLARGGRTICGCGRVLTPVTDPSGQQIGVTHSVEDDDHHMEFWRSLRIGLANAERDEGRKGT